MIDPIEVLAEYLSGPQTVSNSIGLGMPPGTVVRVGADAFFKLREAFNVRGYANKAEATDAINNTLARRALKGSV